MKKVGVVGIGLKRLSQLKGVDALNASGNNFGNMLFTHAAYEQIKNAHHIGFKWNVESIKEECSSIFIPAANWLNVKQDWGYLADLIEKTDLPCTVVGLGSQIDDLSDVDVIPTGTKRFLKIASERSSGIAVRGEFTAEVVKSCGVNNIEVLGCPSIFSSGTVPKIRQLEPVNVRRLGIGPTRYVLNKINNNNRLDKQRQLYQFAIRNASSIYFQSESYEIKILSRDLSSTEEEKVMAKGYYGFDSENDFLHEIMLKGKYHTNLSSWIADARKDDLYVGSRIHGVIAATLAGTPAVLITHDNRTKELADCMCVPSIDIENFELAMLYDVPEFLSNFDFEKFMRRSRVNLVRLMEFYKSNSLKNNLRVLNDL